MEIMVLVVVMGWHNAKWFHSCRQD